MRGMVRDVWLGVGFRMSVLVREHFGGKLRDWYRKGVGLENSREYWQTTRENIVQAFKTDYEFTWSSNQQAAKCSLDWLFT